MGAAVERSPYHAGATAWVRAHLPKGLAPRGFHDLADWLDFLDVHATGSVEVFGPDEPAPEGTPAAVTLALDAARSKWRKDLVGFRNGPLLVVSPPERPGVIARSLTRGRVVSDALDVAFQSIGPRRDDDEVLVLHLFPSQSEYLAQSRGGSGEEPGHGFGGLERTAGHYDPGANVTRIFFPGVGGNDSVLSTYAHELTHHWVSRRRPARAADGSVDDRSNGPGYWIVEGIADFVAAFDFASAEGRAEPKNPRADYADVVAHVPPASAIPWATLFTLTQGAAYDDDPAEVRVPRRWRMGLGGRYRRTNLFYAQSAAATAYLFLAEDGRHRPAALAYLYDYYAGNAEPDSILKAVGLSADELGARIVKWCASVVAAPK